MKKFLLLMLIPVGAWALDYRVSWDRVLSWSDNTAMTADEKGRVTVRVERSTTASGPWTAVATSLPGADNVAVSDLTIRRGTWYYFRGVSSIDNTESVPSAGFGYINLTGPVPPGGFKVAPK